MIVKRRIFRAAFQAFKNTYPLIGYHELKAILLDPKYNQSCFWCFGVVIKVAI